MEIIEKNLEMRGMNRREIIDYFINMDGIINTGYGRFAWPDGGVEVSEESLVSLGSLKIPSTTVVFQGEKESLEQMISAFRMKFLSAGG